jgi:hypothetical protein
MYFLFAGPVYDHCAFGMEAFVKIFNTLEEAKFAGEQVGEIAEIAELKNDTLEVTWNYNNGVYMWPHSIKGWSEVNNES